MDTTHVKQTRKKYTYARRSSRQGFNPKRFKQQDTGAYNVTTTVPTRIVALLKTEAAINNKSVSVTLLDILEQRYRLVD